MGKNGNRCGTGIHIVDVHDPKNPEFMGCFDGSRYVHDAQCVIYAGPDTKYVGSEICFMFTPDMGDLTVVDITEPDHVRGVICFFYAFVSNKHLQIIFSVVERAIFYEFI